MPDRDTTSWGSAAPAGPGAAPGNSGEIAGVAENSTLAVTNHTTAPARCMAPELVWVPWLAMAGDSAALYFCVEVDSTAELNGSCSSTEQGERKGTSSDEFDAAEDLYVW